MKHQQLNNNTKEEKVQGSGAEAETLQLGNLTLTRDADGRLQLPSEATEIPFRTTLEKGRPKGIIQTSGEWVSNWRPPEYLVTGILQRRFLYLLTAPAGHGKTAIALTLAAHVALGRQLGDYPVKQGRVLYLAGENPDDIMTRWLVLAEEMNFDPDTIPLDVIDSTGHGIKLVHRDAVEDYALVIVDTDQAYYDGEDMNSNTDRKAWAQAMRTLVELPGGPCVLVLAHPPKEARTPPFRPYGGSAFLNEADANIFLVRNGDFILFKRDPYKFRGPDFEAVPFSLRFVTSQKLHSEPVTSVIAVPLTSDAYASRGAKSNNKDTELVSLIYAEPGLSLQEMAVRLGGDWTKGKVNNRLTKHLAKSGFVEKDARGKYEVTVRSKRAFKPKTK